jgi:hypothetical protein
MNSTRLVVSSVAFIDNGTGMIPNMTRFALSWGGGTPFDDPNFIGKFGFGLPDASINQTRKVEACSRLVQRPRSHNQQARSEVAAGFVTLPGRITSTKATL